MSTRQGCEFLEHDGPTPSTGTELELLDVANEHTAHYLVARVGRSPLPSDARDCAYLQRVTPRGDVGVKPAARDPNPSAPAANAA
jgi:hypothetical protein